MKRTRSKTNKIILCDEIDEKLFNSTLWGLNRIFDNNNRKYMWGFEIKGNALYYEEGHVTLDDVLFYVGNKGIDLDYKTVNMNNLLVYAYKDPHLGLDVRERTIYFKCKITRSLYELVRYVEHESILKFDPCFWEYQSEGPFFDDIYATKDSISEAELRSDPNVIFYNTRYFKIDSLERDYGW